MEIVEIKSSHSLLTSKTADRPVGEHTYKLSCRQFGSTYRSWRKDNPEHDHPLAVMTLGFERIWMTAQEAEQVAAAIQSARSPIAID